MCRQDWLANQALWVSKGPAAWHTLTYSIPPGSLVHVGVTHHCAQRLLPLSTHMEKLLSSGDRD